MKIPRPSKTMDESITWIEEYTKLDKKVVRALLRIRKPRLPRKQKKEYNKKYIYDFFGSGKVVIIGYK